MKKSMYTLAFIALFSVMSKAQSTHQVKKEGQPNQEKVNPDGTVAPAADETKAKESKKEETKPAAGTRMAITEKGVPASKSADSKKAGEPKKAEPAKTEKQ